MHNSKKLIITIAYLSSLGFSTDYSYAMHQNELNELLFDAIEQESPEEIKRLLNLGANLEAETLIQNEPTTPLEYAVTTENPTTVKKLLKLKANPNSVCTLMGSSYTGKTPLHAAAATGNSVITELLLTYNANVNAQNIVGFTPLMWAINSAIPSKAKKRLVKTFLNHQATVNCAGNSIYAQSQAHDANNSEEQSEKFFLPSDYNGSTALHLAVKQYESRIAQMLILAGADCAAVNENGMTPYTMNPTRTMYKPMNQAKTLLSCFNEQTLLPDEPGSIERFETIMYDSLPNFPRALTNIVASYTGHFMVKISLYKLAMQQIARNNRADARNKQLRQRNSLITDFFRPASASSSSSRSSSSSSSSSSSNSNSSRSDQSSSRKRKASQELSKE